MSWAGQREFDEFAARRSDETPTSARTSSIGSMPSRQLAEKKFLARHYSFRLRFPPLKMTTI
jgi:hypothetical protein